MIFSRKLYLGDNIKHPTILKAKLRMHKLLSGTFVLRLAQNKSDYVEIIDGKYYLQPLAYREDNYIVGFAASYGEALSLVEKMMQDCLDETGQVDLRYYLIQKNRKNNQ